MTERIGLPFGERATLFPLARDLDRRALLEALQGRGGPADVVLAEEIGCAIDRAEDGVAPVDVAAAFAIAAGPHATPASARVHEVLTVYDGEDLTSVAEATGATSREIIERHAAREYAVSMMGFMPGFAYLRELDERLVLARRATPRTRVPAGAVAISAHYTAIYPFASPGGWHLLGRALDFYPFEAGAPRFALGDRIRFTPIDAQDPRAHEAATRAGAEAPIARVGGAHAIGIREARGLAIIVDGGRVGFMHAGVPRSGPLSRAGLARANVAAGNAAGAPAIELYGGLEIEAVGGALTVTDDAGACVHLAEGERASFSSSGGRVRYVAVARAFDVPRVMGSATTLLVAGLGGFCGRALRRGDVIAIGTGTRAQGAPLARVQQGAHPAREAGAPIETLVGPDAAAHPESIDRLARATWRVSTSSDRTGTRLEEPSPSRRPYDTGNARRASIPMIEGAVQLTPTGLVVLGPDHPTTGGYPVIAVVSRAGLEALSSIPLGGTLRLSAPITPRGTLGP